MEDILENQVLQELKDNQFDGPDFGKRKVMKTKSSMSTTSIDSGIGLTTLKSSHSTVSSLISDLDTTGCTIAEVPWDLERADLVIKVNDTLFPVHRSLVSLYSDVLKNIIFSVNFGDEDTQMVTLMEQTVESIHCLLTYIYFQDKEIKGELSFFYSSHREIARSLEISLHVEENLLLWGGAFEFLEILYITARGIFPSSLHLQVFTISLRDSSFH